MLRVGVLGFGARSAITQYVEQAPTQARVVAIGEPTARGQAEATAAFPDAAVVPDLSTLLTHDLDAVMILTPDDQHADQAITALHADLAVFVEKPLAITVADADRVLRAAQVSGSRLYIGHNMRHMPVIRLLRELIDTGRIGAVKALWCRHFVGHGGDYYFKDWHADRRRTTGLLLQKGAHDIDVIHWLAGGSTRRVAAMGALAVYGAIDDRLDRSDQRMRDWFSVENWPPTEQTGLHPVVDVEDISMMHLHLDNGVLASYQQCHFTPDYWRNYTVIGTHGRLENFGDGAGDQVALWNRRHAGRADPDETFTVPTSFGSHGGADPQLVAEFLWFAAIGGATDTNPLAAREAVAAAELATKSLRSGGGALDVPEVPQVLAHYFAAHQSRT